MNQHSPRDLPMMMREGTEFVMNGRKARIAQNRGDDCLVLWHEHIDEKTGEVIPQTSAMLPFFDIGRALERNQMRITARPVQRPDGRVVLQEASKRMRSIVELSRAAWRLSYIEAAQELISEGKMGRTRAQYVQHFDAIRGRGDAKQTRNAKKATGRSKAGFEYKTRSAPECAETIFRWVNKYRADTSSIFDRQSESGNTKLRYIKDELDLAREIINTRLTEERPSIKNISDSVQAVFGVENRRRGALPVCKTAKRHDALATCTCGP